MKRITELFKQKQKNILNVYCTAGYPSIDSILPVMRSLQIEGADMIEIGMPYSDPLADGPVIQASSMQALANGMTLAKLFSQLKDFRKDITVPVLLMGYMNPVLQYGFDRFCADAKQAGIDGLILPDLPVYEFETQYGSIIQKHQLDFIFLITPETPDERVRKLDAMSTGFLYAVSSSATTGNNKDIAGQSDYFKRLQSLNLKNPILVGFGIKDRETFGNACRYANGAIIGTAYIKALEGNQNIEKATGQFLKTIL